MPTITVTENGFSFTANLLRAGIYARQAIAYAFDKKHGLLHTIYVQLYDERGNPIQRFDTYQQARAWAQQQELEHA